MRSPTRTRAYAVVISFLVLGTVTACGSSTDSSASGPQATSTSTATSAMPDAWVALRDKQTGVSFSLPHRVEPQSRTQPAEGSRVVDASVYQDEIDGTALSVSIVQPHVLIDTGYPRTVLDSLVSTLTKAGATDVRLTAIRKAQVPSGTALDGTLTFTATNGQNNYWRLRTIASGRLAVQIQVINFSEPGDTRAATKAGNLFERLTQSTTVG